MVENNFSDAVTTNMTSGVKNYSAQNKSSDGLNAEGETTYDNPDFSTYNGYYKAHPELKKPIDALATYCVGKGYTTDDVMTKVILEHISGSGEDTFESIAWNLIVTKKVNGDAYAQIIRDDKTGKLINLKPLDPSIVSVVYDRNGIIKEYRIKSKVNKDATPKKLPVNEVFHLMNDRVYDEIHGTSVVECCKWIMDARTEAMNDWRRISHRATIRVMYVDIRNTAKLTRLKSDYKDAINKGELLILPVKKEDASFEELSLPPVDAFLSWIKYLENYFYQALGVPKIILGGSEEFTEASSKIALVTFDQYWKKEQRDFEADFFNQVYLKIKWNEPVSLMNELITAEGKNESQTGFQPNDVQAGVGK